MLKFLENFEIKTSFLFEDPIHWADNCDFQAGRMLCDAINVTNDCAERAISLCSSYNNVGPKDGKQKNEMIIEVAHNRRNQCNSLKSSVNQYFTSK